ncbi:MAG: hypothetical protein ACI9UK_001861 [Candidatus Krumholzibacteriia bacterium]|jgi:uncharacterized protein YbjQ (UPF0145 family)
MKMAKCPNCEKTGFGFLEIKDGKCPSCRLEAERKEAAKTDDVRRAETEARVRTKAAASGMILTTETTVGSVERLGIVATEVVLGMNIFRDVLANVRDIFGGRSGAVQKTLDEAREAAFDELRIKASELGADAVIAVDIDYHSISTGSSVNMMMVAVSGTAVKLS